MKNLLELYLQDLYSFYIIESFDVRRRFILYPFICYIKYILSTQKTRKALVIMRFSRPI